MADPAPLSVLLINIFLGLFFSRVLVAHSVSPFDAQYATWTSVYENLEPGRYFLCIFTCFAGVKQYDVYYILLNIFGLRASVLSYYSYQVTELVYVFNYLIVYVEMVRVEGADMHRFCFVGIISQTYETRSSNEVIYF